MAQPKTLPHEFILPTLKAHFSKTPNPPGANDLIDTPGDTFLDTEDEINVIAGALWMLSVKYDILEERPKDLDGLKKWIARQHRDVVGKLANKVEPPFAAWTIDQIQKDVSAMMEELLVPTLPPQEKKVDGKEAKK